MQGSAIDGNILNLLRSITDDYPNFTIHSAVTLGEGWDNIAVEINNEYIFRFPKREDVPMEREVAVLKALQGKITLPIPNIEFIGSTVRYIGYRKLPGVVLRSELENLTELEIVIASTQLGQFLYEVHAAFTNQEVKALNVPKVNPEEEINNASYLLSQSLPSGVHKTVEAVIEEYQSIIRKIPEQTVLFNDLHDENIVYDPKSKKISGVFDFSDVAFGDRDIDFRDFYLIGRGFLERVTDEYGRISGKAIDLRRVIVYSRINTLAVWAKKFNSTDHTQKALKKIHRWIEEESEHH